jgi:lysophospholipase L1-like esterase
MTPDDEAIISAEIDRAYAFAERGAADVAALSFAAARSMCTSLADPGAVEARLERQWSAMIREREEYRRIIADRCIGRPGGTSRSRGMVIFSDSLGLPRPDAKTDDTKGAAGTYPYMLVDRLSGHTVNSFCQRYFTTRDILNLIQADAELGIDADVLVHVGLNDAPWRMFSEPDRLSLDLLAPDLKDRIVQFAQKYRSLIISELPEYHYVDPPDYQANLDTILETLKTRGARAMVTTTILPPVRFWSFTPGLQRNFARYNLILMDAAHRHGATLIDLDRLVWDKQHDGVLLPDGMHFSTSGHEIVADHVAALLM